ncbi:MAG: glycosyltransferase family 4 protein [Promethearchaeota archaeon]
MKNKPKIKRLNILVVTHKTESFVRDLTIHTSELGNNIILYGPKPGRKDLESILKSKVIFIPTRVRSIFTSGEKIEDQFLEKPRLEMFRHFFSTFIELYRLIKKFKIDLIHAHWVLPSGFISSLISYLFKKPLIITAHGRSIYFNPKLGKTVPKKGYVRILYKFVFNRMRKIIAVSKYVKEVILDLKINPSKVKIIYNGTDINQFNPSNEGDEVKDKLKIKDDFIILTVRKFFYRKGLQYLIKAISLIKKKIPNIKLIIIGYGPYESNLKALTNKLALQNHVLFLGKIQNQNLPPYYAASDVFVIPSLVEGFGVAAAEAMAMELPLISTNIKGLIEVSDSRNAIVIPPANESAIADAIIKLWQDPNLRKELGKKGRQKVLNLFNWPRAAQEYNNLYKSLIKK